MPLKSGNELQLEGLPITEQMRRIQAAYRALRNDIGMNALSARETAGDTAASRFDRYIGVTNTDAARTITLPAAGNVENGHMLRVMDESGGAWTNNIEVAPDGTDTIDGVNASVSITEDYGCVQLICRNGAWFVLDRSKHPDNTIIPFALNITATSTPTYLILLEYLATDDRGFTIHRPGSIVGVSAHCQVATHAGSPSLSMQARVNAASIFTADLVVDGTGYKYWYNRQNRGVDTIVAGDRIAAYLDFTIGGGETLTIHHPNALIEIAFD